MHNLPREHNAGSKSRIQLKRQPRFDPSLIVCSFVRECGFRSFAKGAFRSFAGALKRRRVLVSPRRASSANARGR
eukprot:5709144-Pleurochrysis_carterae.AAC.1